MKSELESAAVCFRVRHVCSGWRACNMVPADPQKQRVLCRGRAWPFQAFERDQGERKVQVFLHWNSEENGCREEGGEGKRAKHLLG